METERLVGLRLKSVKPEKIVPNFIQWLSKKGEVKFGESNPLEQAEHRVRSNSGETQAVRVSVRLSQIQIGYLDFYVNPLAVSYIGHREVCMEIPFERSRSVAETDHGELIKTMVLIYLWEPHRGDKQTLGRADGHKRIPFP